jgi:hypothetical protein
LFGCGECNFCKLEIKSEEFHTQGIWREIANGLESTLRDYSHTSRDPVHGSVLPVFWPFVFTRRGFIDEVRCTLADWMQHGPQIVRKHPVTRVTLTDRKPLRNNLCNNLWCLGKVRSMTPIEEMSDIPNPIYECLLCKKNRYQSDVYRQCN